MKVTPLRYLDAKFHHPSPKIKKIPKNTNGRLAIPALAGLLVINAANLSTADASVTSLTHCGPYKSLYTVRQHNWTLFCLSITLLQVSDFNNSFTVADRN